MRARPAQGPPIKAMVTNGIVGSAGGDFGLRDAQRLRLFAGGPDDLRREGGVAFGRQASLAGFPLPAR